MRVCIYSRVSTDDKRQDPLNQLLQLRDFAQRQGWTVVCEYADQLSAKNGDRQGFKFMWKDAEAHRFDCLLFWSLDRLTREGPLATLQYLQRLSDHGIKFKSYTEQYVDSLGVFGPAIIGILAAVAQQERIRLSERTKAGLARVRAKGKRLGRPRSNVDMDVVNSRLSAGESLRSVARDLGVSPALLVKRRQAPRALAQ